MLLTLHKGGIIKVTILTHNPDGPLSHECTAGVFNVHQAHTCQSYNPKARSQALNNRRRMSLQPTHSLPEFYNSMKT